MSAELLLQQLERIGDVPGAVARLRQFLIDTAVGGTLTPQNPKDRQKFQVSTPAGGTNGLNAPLLATDRCPASWMVTSIENCLAELEDGRTLHQGWSPQCETRPASPAEWGMLKTTAIQPGRFEPQHNKFLPPHLAPRPVLQVSQGDLLITCAGPRARCGVACLVRHAACRRLISGKMYRFRMRQGIDPGFMELFLLSEAATTSIDTMKTGSSESGLNLTHERFRKLVVRIPPLDEQRRIVAKVDELMVLCDELEIAQEDRERQRDQLRAVSLHRLIATNADSDSMAEVSFFLNTLPRLITRSEHIASVRRAIVELAVRGRLVPQNSDDEITSDLLRRIPDPAKSRRPASSGAFVVENADRPFDIPASWAWIRLGRLITKSDAGWSPKTENFPRSDGKWGVLKVSAVSWDVFRPEENKQLLPGVEPREVARVRQGDFLISRANTSELVAKAVIVPEEPHNLMLSDKTVRLAFAPLCNSTYLLLVNNHAQYARDYYVIEASGASPSMKNVSRDVIYQLPIPLPPLAEQHRIVSKVDALMAVCGEIETALRSTQYERSRLLEVLLHEALNEGAESMALAEAVAEAN